MSAIVRDRVRAFLASVAGLRVASFAADFADVSLTIDVQERPGCTPTIKIKGLRLAPDEVSATVEALAHLTDRLGRFAALLRADDAGVDSPLNDDDPHEEWPPPEARGGALPPDPPPPVTPPLGTRRKGRPPGARNKPKAAPPAPPPEPAPSEPEAAPADPPAEPPPESTPVHEPPAQLALPNPIPVPDDLDPVGLLVVPEEPEPPPVAPEPTEADQGGVRWLLERLEQEGGAGDPRGWAGVLPEEIGEATARGLVRPLGGVEGAPALLRLTDAGWSELEKGRA